MASLPRAVQAQLDQAVALEAQLAGAPVTPVQTEPAPVAATPSEPEPQVTPQPPAAPQDEVWEQKYKTLRGMFDSEVPRLHAQVRESNQQLQILQKQIDELKAAKPEAVAPVKPLVTEQDKEAFGADLVDLQERIARAVAVPLEDTIKELKERLGKYESTAQTTAQQQAVTAEERYFERLASRIPDWEQINADQNWVSWLAGKYPGMTTTRQEQLNFARANLNVEATVEMFKAYKELTAPAQVTNQSKLQSQVAPSSSKGNAPTATEPSKRIWTSAEIAKAQDFRVLKDMTPEQVERVFAEIDLAVAEGRVKL